MPTQKLTLTKNWEVSLTAGDLYEVCHGFSRKSNHPEQGSMSHIRPAVEMSQELYMAREILPPQNTVSIGTVYLRELCK